MFGNILCWAIHYVWQYLVEQRKVYPRMPTYITKHTVCLVMNSSVFATVNKKDDDRHGALRQAQKTAGKVNCGQLAKSTVA
jgi:hypothetical protein